MRDERLISPHYIGAEDHQENTSLRPLRLVDYIGQSKVKQNIQVFIEAARGRGESLDHILLADARTGKTTLAPSLPMNWQADSQNLNPAMNGGDLAAILTNLEPRILFIDEIPLTVQ